jgi:hypothetical protein
MASRCPLRLKVAQEVRMRPQPAPMAGPAP